MNHSSSIWKDEMQSSFLRRYLKYILIAASNWHDKRFIASGWHFSHPSCHWKHNAFAMCLFFSTSVQSQSLGHANGAVASCSLLFVAPPHQPKNWEEGITPMNCFPLFKHDVEWMGTVEHPQVWEDGQHGIWHCRCNIKCGGRLCFASCMLCTEQGKI